MNAFFKLQSTQSTDYPELISPTLEPLEDDIQCYPDDESLGVHYPFITPQAPTGALFALSTRPRAPASQPHVRLVGPKKRRRLPRLPPLCSARVSDEDNGLDCDVSGFDSGQSDLSQYGLHLRVVSRGEDGNLLSFDQAPSSTRIARGVASPGQSDVLPLSSSSSSSPSLSQQASPLSRTLDHLESAAHAVRAVHRAEWQTPHVPLTAPASLLDSLFASEPLLTPTHVSPLDNEASFKSRVPPPAANPIASVRLSDNLPVIAFPAHNGLHSLALATLEPRPRLALRSAPPPYPLLFDDASITHVRAVDAIGADPACILAATADSVVVATASDDTGLRFCAAKDEHILDASISTWTREVSMLTPSGLLVAPSHSLHQVSVHDVHPVDRRAAFFSAAYAMHPRVILLAGKLSLATVDLRAPDTSLTTRLRHDEWHLPSSDKALSVVRPVHNSLFHAVTATSSLIAYLDLRSPAEPLLRLPYEMPTPVSLVATCRVQDSFADSSSVSDVLAFAAPLHNYLAVAHAVHQSRPSNIASPLEGAGVPLPNPSTVWGDEPLDFWDAVPATQPHVGPGLALLPVDSRRLHVAYWSRSTGLTAIPLRLKRDDVFDFLCNDSDNDSDVNVGISEGIEKQSDKSEHLWDSSIDMANTRKAILENGYSVHAQDRELHPVSCSVGAKLHARTFRLPLKIATSVREAICSTKADEFCEGARLPRTDMAGLIARGAVKMESPVNPSDLRQELMASPLLLQDVARVARSGSHEAGVKTPLVDCLARALDASPFVETEDVTWHEGCPQSDKHDRLPNCVSTDGDLPDWIERKVFFNSTVDTAVKTMNKSIDTHSTDESYGKEPDNFVDNGLLVPADSALGKLMERMQTFFFEKGEL